MKLDRITLSVGVSGCCLLLVGCHREAPGSYQGYIEGEYVYVASPVGGELRQLWVRRGEAVTNGQALFQLEPEPEREALETARARLAQAEADLANRQKGLRPSEIEALEADLRRWETEQNLAELSLRRREAANTDRPGAVSEEALDRSRAEVASIAARIAQARADLETGRLGAREDEIRMGSDVVAARRAELTQAEWILGQKGQEATADGVVHDTLYRVGEYVAPGRPVVVLLPPGNLFARFFVPQPDLERVRVGQEIRVSWDGLERPQSATVRYISTRAEYTPPVIYSQETRAKLVYLVEAVFESPDPVSLKVGQPVDVRIVVSQDE